MTIIKRKLTGQICIVVVVMSSLLLFTALLTNTLQQFIEAFAKRKPGLWGEPAWYVFLMVAGGALVVALLINVVLIAFKPVYKRHALLLIGLTLVQGLFYSSVTPPWQAPDEHAHYEYAALMGELNRVPRLADVRWEGASMRDGFYYAVYLGTDDYGMGFIIPDADWIDGRLREVLDSILDRPQQLTPSTNPEEIHHEDT